MKPIPCMFASLAALAAAGCFTIVETPHPEIVIDRAPETAPAVNVGGYAAQMVEYLPVYGWETRYVCAWGRGGRRHRGGYGGYWETVSTQTSIPHAYVTDAYLRRAAHLMEDAGLIVGATNAQYEVSAEFAGPFSPEGTGWRAAAIDIGSVFFALYDATSMRLDLRIRDVSTGRVVFSKTFEQEYECCAFSPFWLFGLAAHDGINGEWQRQWCMSALTDASAAAAIDFLSGRTAGGAQPPAAKKAK